MSCDRVDPDNDNNDYRDGANISTFGFNTAGSRAPVFKFDPIKNG